MESMLQPLVTAFSGDEIFPSSWNALHKRSRFCFDLWCPLSCKLIFDILTYSPSLFVGPERSFHAPIQQRAKNSCTLNILPKLNLTTQTQISSYEKNSAEKSLVPWDPLGYLGSLTWVQIMECFQNSMGLGSEGQCHSYTSSSIGRALGEMCFASTMCCIDNLPFGKRTIWETKVYHFHGTIWSDNLQCPSFGGKNVPRVHISCGLRHSPYNTAIEQLQN